MHDQGLLLAPREGGEIALLVGCVKEGKAFNDEYLTKIIQGKSTLQKNTEDCQPTKRARITT
jgi:hypothetical protein